MACPLFTVKFNVSDYPDFVIIACTGWAMSFLGKWELDDEDGGAGNDRDQVDMIELTIVRC